MLRTRSALSPEPRRGVILLVVLCLLTLFAILGLTFVLYADASRQSARLHLDSQAQRRPDAEPELLLSYFLGQLLFDVPDDARGVYSGLRGHSLSRNLFGLNDAGPNDVPFNGTGRQHFDPMVPAFARAPAGTPARDDSNLINYTYFAGDGFLRDPERRGRRGWRDGLPPAGAGDNRKPFSGGFNAPYTYPDLNNLFLAAVKADGTVLLPSYHRPWAGFDALDPSNWRWVSDVDPTLPRDHPLYNQPQPWLKYLTLRPRPIDMGPGFPLPEPGGDVKNLIGGPGGNDSIWVDLDFPVLRAPDGRLYKPLFAPLVVDLDNRVNLNVHGNLRGLAQTTTGVKAGHASHQGWGPWEVNPEHLTFLPRPTAAGYAAAVDRRAEWANLLSGGTAVAPGRYGWGQWPHSLLPGNLAPGPSARFYGPVDFDGSRELPTGSPSIVGRPSAQLNLPGDGRTRPYLCFPAVPPRAGFGNGSAAERANHPLLFNPFQPAAQDRTFALSNLEALLRQGDTGSAALSSELLRLCPRNFLDKADPAGSARRRRLVTLASFDQDRPGVSPWFWTSAVNDPSYGRLPPVPPLTTPAPAGVAIPFPPDPRPIFLESEFGPDGRATAALTALRRLDLNRYLPDYPNPDPRTGRITDLTGFAVAQTARQYLAAELFELLWRVTGAGNPALTPPPEARNYDAARWDALRWLAQLAANIVDFIDTDDYMTPFLWFADARTGRQEWVYGTELPRVVLNEAYVEYTNDPNDMGLRRLPRAGGPHATRWKANVWVELYNPFQDDPPVTAPSRSGAAQLELPAAGGSPAYGIYQLRIAWLRQGVDLRQPDNVRGELPSGALEFSALSKFSDGRNAQIAPLPATAGTGGGFFSPVGDNKGFCVLGPSLNPPEVNPFAPGGAAFETLRRPEMSYLTQLSAPSALIPPSLLWQRLACPHLPPQPNPALAFHNPYITVDYMRDVAANYAAEFDGNGRGMPTVVHKRFSVGRQQPYAAHFSQLKQQWPKQTADDGSGLTGQPQHTFFQHNVDRTTPGPNWRAAPANYRPFEWLFHADRQLISPAELLHVSGFKPHELTQQFRTGDNENQKFNHRAPWLDEDLVGASPPQSHRLYRALEFLSTHSRILGMNTASTKSPAGFPRGGATPPYPNQQVRPEAMSGATASGGTWRIEVGSTLVIDRGKASEEVVRVKEVEPSPTPTWFKADFLKYHGPDFALAPATVSERLPGKINLNTVWDEETFLALCDPNPSNTFHRGGVGSIFRNSLLPSRTPGGKPGPTDRPFQSFGAGLGLAGSADSGLQDSLLRFDRNSPARLPMLAVAGQNHPYHTFELLTKVFNHATVRSNVFAVWLTVGFFEVTDASARPVKLGAEVGRAEGRHVRHRMFAIVDRSVLTANPGPQPRFNPRGPLPGFSTGPVVPHFSIID